MKKKCLNCRFRMPMNIQFFAEPGEEGDPDTGDGSGEPTFDDFLKNQSNQEEFDRRVQEAVNTAVTDAQKKWQLMTDNKLSEAEKLAKMTKEEKAQYMQRKKEKEIEDREAAVTKKELMAEAKNTLTEKKLPVGLAEVLDYTDADSCNKSIATVEKAFQEAVEAAVRERLKGGNPIKKAPEGDGTFYSREQIEKMTPEEVNKNWDAISKSMASWTK